MKTSTSFLVPLAALVLSTLCATTAPAQDGDDCGDPNGNGDITTVDALLALRAAVGTEECDLCVCDVNDSGDVTSSDALEILRTAVDLETTLDCPECVAEVFECPGVAQFALFGGIRNACTTNADCTASVCDTEIGRCRTSTEVDVGWTGFGHNGELNDPVPARLFVDCGENATAPCGECTITGHDPSLGNCRCENDNRTRCFTVDGPDAENCGGEQCICNFGPPLPLLAGGTPVCVLNTLNGQPSGTANVDSGSGAIEIHLLEKVYFGIGLLTPCPICANDPTPRDGVRGGACVGGRNDTESCDAQSYNSTFPPPTGAFYSLDCFPLEGQNIAGEGLQINMTLTTGQQSLAADVPCATEGEFAEYDCFCRACSNDAGIACDDDSDCSDGGTCTSNGGGTQTLPNACTDLVCEPVAEGAQEGRCATGPDDNFCDGLMRPNGDGLIPCGLNADCEAQNIGVDAGACTVTQRRACFLDPIVSQGAPHPVAPLAAAVFCSPATGSSPVNEASGLPGPGRLTLQSAVTLFCEAETPQYTAIYTPGVGNCPQPE